MCSNEIRKPNHTHHHTLILYTTTRRNLVLQIYIVLILLISILHVLCHKRSLYEAHCFHHIGCYSLNQATRNQTVQVYKLSISTWQPVKVLARVHLRINFFQTANQKLCDNRLNRTYSLKLCCSILPDYVGVMFWAYYVCTYVCFLAVAISQTATNFDK